MAEPMAEQMVEMKAESMVGPMVELMAVLTEHPMAARKAE